ncbi:ATP-binding protein [Thalassobius vesicularis]|uniref:ATP-binding protein n=1 Tax=Thalassobius vesicularis TaxID=1294297 RepID=A0A4S3M4X4_9RHOB|nr:ATP-binding protein [Thalassobius vesicularis]THD71365.1 ATP-binding protein [Thalassobius vesicularis]
MALRIITADERLSASENKTSLAVFGPPGVGKTTLIRTLPADKAVCLDLEAGMKSVQDWRGPSIPIRSFSDFRDLVVLIGGADPSQPADGFYSAGHFAHVQKAFAESGIEEFLKKRTIIFVDSITDLTRQAMAWAKQQPEAFSDRTGKPDIRGAYGLLGREVIQALKHLQHARGKTVIFVGVLEKVTDEFGASAWVPQMEGSKAGRELPGIVDQVISMQLFGRDAEGGWVLDEQSAERRLVCTSGNPWGLPAKDRSGRLDMTEPPDLSALLARIDGRGAPAAALTTHSTSV